MPSPIPQPAGSPPSANVRSLITLALLIHLFVVLLAISANYLPSALQGRIVSFLAPYSQPLNLKLSDPFSYKIYHLTHGETFHDDHFVEIEIVGGTRSGQVIRLPDAELRGSANRNRLRALTRMLGVYAQGGDDEMLAGLFRGMAPHFLADEPESRAIVRVRRHVPVPLNADAASQQRPLDPNAPIYFETLYEANVSLDSSGNANLSKIEAAGQVSPLRNSEGTND